MRSIKIKLRDTMFTILISAIFAFSFIACNNCDSIYDYYPPELINDGIETGTLVQVGIDSTLIAKAIGCIYANKFDQVHSMLIYKDNMLVFEKYFEGNKYKWDGPDYYGDRIQWDKDSMHVIMSCTKSFTSACIGIAVNRGYIKSVNESIFNYLPSHQHLKTDEKDRITIEHLLTMTSGLKWDEWGAHDPSSNDIDIIYSYCQSDPVSCVLEKPLEYNPGEKFTYNGGGMIILGEILKNATNMNIEDFSDKYLFDPLGIDTVHWYQFENGAYACDGSLIMRPRDMLKFGVTYLNEGKWNNEKILPKDWVEKSKKTYNNNIGINIPIDDSGKNGYAYSWWTNEISISGKKVKLFQAGGWGGQEIIVFPDYNMVIVFTGGNYTVKKHIYKILERYILPAIE
jgi:CubicO group peptidase (beta-lactamase class C family)